MLNGFGFAENPWLSWLRWFGVVTEFVTKGLLRLMPTIPFWLAFTVGFLANVACWALVLAAVTRIVSRARREAIVEH